MCHFCLQTCKATTSDKQEHVDDQVLGGLGCSEFFLACVSSLKREELIKRSPRGQRVKVMLDLIETMEQESVAEIARFLILQMNSCLVAGYRHKLTSAAQASVWSTFHSLRSSQHVKHTWNAFISAQVPQSHQKEPQLALQLLLDRVLKRLIENKAKATRQHTESSAASSVRPLTALESNGLRYMAGYVAVSLLKKYRKPSKHPQVQLKRTLFVRVLIGMRAVDQPGEPDSPLDYSKVWSELIDRGGLYHIDDKVIVNFVIDVKNN